MTKRINSFLKTLLIVASSTLFSLTALAQSDEDSGYSAMKRPGMFAAENKPFVGLTAGVTAPEGDRDESAEVGVEIGIQPNETAGLSLEYNNATIDNGIDETTRNTVLAKAAYNFGGDTTLIKDSYVALGAGAVFLPDKTAAVATPIIGFDIPVTKGSSDYMTLGANARYAFVAEGEDDTMTLNGAVKYWY